MIFELLVAGAFALATLRRYSGQIWHIRSLVILAILFLSMGLPTTEAVSDLQLPAIKFDNLKPWMQPCGSTVGDERRPQQRQKRHSAHRVMKRVKTQLKLAWEYLKKDHNNVHEIYEDVCMGMGEQYRKNWLSDNHGLLEWYGKEIQCLEKAKKAEHILPRMYDMLQKFAITFDHLSQFRLKSDINASPKRNKTINGIYNEIIKVQCEVEDAIQTLGMQVPTAHTDDNISKSSNWAMEGDLTTMLIQDCGVLKLCWNFLKNWTQIFRHSIQNGTGVCDPNDPASMSFRPIIKKHDGPRWILGRSKVTGTARNKSTKKRPDRIAFPRRKNSLFFGRNPLSARKKKEHPREGLAKNKEIKTMLTSRKRNSMSPTRKGARRKSISSSGVSNNAIRTTRRHRLTKQSAHIPPY